MKPIEIENKKLAELIINKDNLVTEGRNMTTEIEKIEKKIEIYQNKEKKITAGVKPDPALKEEGDKLAQIFTDTLARLEEIGKEIEQKKLEAIPKEMEMEHKALLKQREQLERERNKCGLKIQKIKDRVVPIIQKECKPLLGEFDDIETAKVKNGKVLISTFNHKDDWVRKFKARQR